SITKTSDNATGGGRQERPEGEPIGSRKPSPRCRFRRIEHSLWLTCHLALLQGIWACSTSPGDGPNGAMPTAGGEFGSASTEPGSGTEPDADPDVVQPGAGGEAESEAEAA